MPDSFGRLPSMDVVNINEVFDRRPKLMQIVPFMLRGVFQCAMKLAKVPKNPRGNQKSFALTNSSEFGKACADLSCNHCTSTPDRSQTDGIAEREYAE